MRRFAVRRGGALCRVRCGWIAATGEGSARGLRLYEAYGGRLTRQEAAWVATLGNTMVGFGFTALASVPALWLTDELLGFGWSLAVLAGLLSVIVVVALGVVRGVPTTGRVAGEAARPDHEGGPADRVPRRRGRLRPQSREGTAAFHQRPGRERRFVRSLGASMFARAESRWGSVIPQPGLARYVQSLWRFFVAVPVVMLFCTAIVVLGVVAAGPWGLPYTAVMGVVVAINTAAIMSWAFLFHRAKVAAGAALGVSRRDSRRLDISGPETLRESLELLREGSE